MVCLSGKCLNSGTIQWSPLKHLRVGESLLNGQACDFSRFFLDSSFWKLPESSHPPSIHLFKVNNGDTRIMYQICSKLILKKLGWRYWPRSVLIVVIFEHILHIVLAFPLLALLSLRSPIYDQQMTLPLPPSTKMNNRSIV